MPRPDAMMDAAASPHAENAGRPAKKARVAYLLQVFPKYSETFIANELIQHQRVGAPVRVLSLRLPREGRFHGCLAELREAAEYVAESMWDQPRKLWEAVRSSVTASPGGSRQAVSTWLRRSTTLRDIWQAMLVRRWADRRGIRHLHCHFGGYAATVAYLSRLMGGPSYSLTLHAHDIFRETVDRALLRNIVSTSAFVVTVSRFNENYLLDQIGVAAERVRVLYNGIPLDRFPYRAGPREPGTVFTVGRLIEKKGFIHLIRACKPLIAQGLLKQCEIVGEGRERDALQFEINRLGLADSVRLAGAWPQERVAQALGRAAVFALPCIMARDGNMDALPTVLLEAMAAGCPVVSTSLSGIPEIVAAGETGLLAPPGDETALAQAMAAILSDPARAQAFAEAGRRRVEDLFDVCKSVDTLATWLNAAASAGTPHAAPANALQRQAGDPTPHTALARE